MLCRAVTTPLLTRAQSFETYAMPYSPSAFAAEESGVHKGYKSRDWKTGKLKNMNTKI